MSEKGQRNQVQQPSKAEKAYGGYLPSVQDEGDRHDLKAVDSENQEDLRHNKRLDTPS